MTSTLKLIKDQTRVILVLRILIRIYFENHLYS